MDLAKGYGLEREVSCVQDVNSPRGHSLWQVLKEGETLGEAQPPSVVLHHGARTD